ncbi:MAG: hypothetical protein ACI8QC_003721, partial [Planctomycetota bacterium]
SLGQAALEGHRSLDSSMVGNLLGHLALCTNSLDAS